MPPLRVLIVDDEPLAHELLEKYTQQCPGIELAGHCWNALEAFSMLHRGGIDLLLLDIKMPEISGIEFLRKMKDPPMVIFTTAYAEHALESYELNALDYLLKPFSQERFDKAIAKAREYHALRSSPAAEIPLLADPVQAVAQDILFVRSEGKLVKIELEKLQVIESLKDYLQLRLEKERIIIHGTMKSMEDQLAHIRSFLRVNKSFMVNLRYITEVDGNLIRVGEYSVPIGKTYLNKVHEIFNKRKLL